jgi:ActR/RegA family two-component response regulator
MERGNSMHVQMPSDRESPPEVTWIDRRFSGRRHEPRPARRRRAREKPGRARPRTRILVVDDDVGTLESYEGVLRDAGFDVATARSAGEALQIARDRRFDLSLVDLHLPDLSGLDLIQRLGEQHGDMTFVVVTGFGTAGSAVAAMKLGVADYVEKPLFGDALIDAVEQALARRHGRERKAHTTRLEIPEAHAYARWAVAVVRAIESPTDPKTLVDWGRAVGASAGALRNWCRTAGLSPKRSLAFARLLRAVSRAEAHGGRAEDLLNIVDRRTLTKMLSLASPEAEEPALPRRVDEFLASQRLISDAGAIDGIRRTLSAR